MKLRLGQSRSKYVVNSEFDFDRGLPRHLRRLLRRMAALLLGLQSVMLASLAIHHWPSHTSPSSHSIVPIIDSVLLLIASGFLALVGTALLDLHLDLRLFHWLIEAKVVGTVLDLVWVCHLTQQWVFQSKPPPYFAYHSVHLVLDIVTTLYLVGVYLSPPPPPPQQPESHQLHQFNHHHHRHRQQNGFLNLNTAPAPRSKSSQCSKVNFINSLEATDGEDNNIILNEDVSRKPQSQSQQPASGLLLNGHHEDDIVHI